MRDLSSEYIDRPVRVGGGKSGYTSKEVSGHATLINNLRVVNLLGEITEYGKRATSSMDFFSFHDYYSGLMHLFINVEAAFNSKQAEVVSAAFECYELLEEECRVCERVRSYDNLRKLITLLEGINREIIRGLVQIGFFFKTNQLEKRGLGTEDLFDTESIFGSKKQKDEVKRE